MHYKLLPLKFLPQAPSLSAEQKIAISESLSSSIWRTRHVFGTKFRFISEHKQVNLAELELIHRNKTGALLTAALKLGFICSPHFENKELEQQLEVIHKLLV